MSAVAAATQVAHVVASAASVAVTPVREHQQTLDRVADQTKVAASAVQAVAVVRVQADAVLLRALSVVVAVVPLRDASRSVRSVKSLSRCRHLHSVV